MNIVHLARANQPLGSTQASVTGQCLHLELFKIKLASQAAEFYLDLGIGLLGQCWCQLAEGMNKGPSFVGE